MDRHAMKLTDAATVIRSKNAGPLQITIDLMFEDEARFDLAQDLWCGPLGITQYLHASQTVVGELRGELDDLGRPGRRREDRLRMRLTQEL